MSAKRSSGVNTDQDIHALAKKSVLHQMRQLWLDTRRAQTEARTALRHAEDCMVRIEEFAKRVRNGHLDPYEVLAILDPTHPEVEAWLNQMNMVWQASQQAAEKKLEPCGADVG